MSAAPLPQAAAPRVLVVEDEAMVAMMLEDMLLDLGCEIVGPAASLVAGLALAESAELDGAVLDVNLAGEKVFPIADLLASRGVPFIYATGYGRAGLRSDDDPRPVVQKPYSVEDLARTLEAAGVLGGDPGPAAANVP